MMRKLAAVLIFVALLATACTVGTVDSTADEAASTTTEETSPTEMNTDGESEEGTDSGNEATGSEGDESGSGEDESGQAGSEDGGDDESSDSGDEPTDPDADQDSGGNSTSGNPSVAQSPPDSAVADVVEEVLPSVVNVRVQGFSGLGGQGSGVVYTSDGVILTNNHVVEGASEVSVVFNDGIHNQPLEGVVVGTAPERDLAVIRVSADDLNPIDLGRSSELRLGDEVLALGFPLGLGGPTVTRGIISGLERTVEPLGGARLEGALQTDAAINPGNSGGALVDMNGQLVGINTAGASAAFAENIGFAIAIDQAIPVIEEILSKPPEQRAWLGVSIAQVDSDLAASQLGLPAGTRGTLVVEVVPDGPADDAGLREGDLIVSLNGDEITSTEDLTASLAERDPGDVVDVEVIGSGGESRTVSVELGQRPPSLG